MDRVKELIEAVYRERRRQTEKFGADSSFKPKITIYLEYEFYLTVVRDISIAGKVPEVQHEFYNRGEIMGHPVFRVIDNPLPKRLRTSDHPDWAIFGMNDFMVTNLKPRGLDCEY